MSFPKSFRHWKCEMVIENGRFGGCFRHPFHQSLTRAPGRFNHFLGFSRQAFQEFELCTADLLTFSTSFLTPLPHFFGGAYFGSSSSLPKMGFSPIYLRVPARRVYGTVFSTGLRPCLPCCPPSSLSLLSSASSHEYHHCKPSVCLLVHIGQTLCPTKRH